MTLSESGNCFQLFRGSMLGLFSEGQYVVVLALIIFAALASPLLHLCVLPSFFSSFLSRCLVLCPWLMMLLLRDFVRRGAAHGCLQYEKGPFDTFTVENAKVTVVHPNFCRRSSLPRSEGETEIKRALPLRFFLRAALRETSTTPPHCHFYFMGERKHLGRQSGCHIFLVLLACLLSCTRASLPRAHPRLVRSVLLRSKRDVVVPGF